MIEVSTDPARLDVTLIHSFLCEESHWAKGISRERVERALEHSLCFAAFDGARQVGFARVVTDRATCAWLADVFVPAPLRGRGISRLLLDAVVAHPDLQGLRRFSLVTSSAPELYASYGFKPLARPEIAMEIVNPDAYAPPA